MCQRLCRLLETKFPDLEVVDELKLGSNLTGQVPATNMMPGKFTSALATVEELHDHARRVRPMLDRESLGSGDSSIDAVVWKKTMEEVERCWLLGPWQKCEVPDDQPHKQKIWTATKTKNQTD